MLKIYILINSVGSWRHGWRAHETLVLGHESHAQHPNHQSTEDKKKPVLQSHVILLLQDGDFVMNESRAAAAYLVNKFGKDDSLYPKVTLFSVRINWSHVLFVLCAKQIQYLSST